MSAWRSAPTSAGWWWVRVPDGAGGYRSTVPMLAAEEDGALIMLAVPTRDFRLHLTQDEIAGAAYAPMAPPPAYDDAMPLNQQCACRGLAPLPECPQHGYYDLAWLPREAPSAPPSAVDPPRDHGGALDWPMRAPTGGKP